MNDWIRMHHLKAKLMGLSEKSLAAGISKMELETRKLKHQLLGSKRQTSKEAQNHDSTKGGADS